MAPPAAGKKPAAGGKSGDKLTPGSSTGPVSASGGGKRGGKGGSLMHTVAGHLGWATFQLVGAVMNIPIALKLLFQLITSPRKTRRCVDRNQLQLPDPLPGLTHEWMETEPGVKLHVVRTSKGSGKPLLLLVHGFPEAWFSWSKQMEALRGDYEVVAIDMRGYGESDKPADKDAYRLDRLAGDVLAVTEKLLSETGQKHLALGAHDWGANLCWAAAYLRPHLYSRLVIMAAPHPASYKENMDWDQFKRSWYMLAFQLPWLPEAVLRANDFQMIEELFNKAPVGVEGLYSAEEIERHKQAMGRPGAAEAAMNYYRCLLDMNSRAPCHELRRAMKPKLAVPTLLLWGENDAAMGQQLLRGTGRFVESLRVEVLPGCSHWIQQQQPEQVNRLLREHLAGAAKA